MAQSLAWYVHRLGRMSAGEVVHRMVQVARSSAQRLIPQSSRVPEPQLPSWQHDFIRPEAGVDPLPYVRRAQDILADRFSFFALENCRLGQPPQWNRDPLTGRVAPLTQAAALDYRDERLVGNIKYLWEPNRHLHLPTLAQAYALTGESRFLDGIGAHLESWLDQCPAGQGPNWSSSLELAIRLINWSLAWQLIGGHGSPLFDQPRGEMLRKRWLEAVFLQVRSIMGRLSRYSSANNHLIGEVAGVWVAAVTWDYWPQMQAWGGKARHILQTQALLQNAPDGCNREQAFSYQQFVLDFLLLAGLAGRAAQQDFAPEYWQRIERMLEFLAAVMDVGGHVPMVGDADDGYAVDLGAADAGGNYRSLLATGALLFDRADFAIKAGELDDKTRWLLGDESVAQWASLLQERRSVACRRAFTDCGYFILGDRFDSDDEVKMLVDAGPLGYLSIAAHGHADALSVALSVGGREVLVDPGTFSYHTQPQWRRYFRSTRAHNTVTIDGLDQSRQSGNFMWSLHAAARCLAFDVDGGVQRFVGEHDGYRQQGLAVTHRRSIGYDTQQRAFVIEDEIDGQSLHQVERRWHLAEDLQPRYIGAVVEVELPQWRIRLEPAEQTALETYRAASAEEGGWISRRFDCKVPTSTVVWRNSVQGSSVLRTRIFIQPRG